MKEGRKLEILEKYLRGKMSEAERSEFETLVQENESWQTFLERYEIMSEALEYQLEKDLVDDFVQQDTNLRIITQATAISKLPFSAPRLASIAAAFLIVFVAIFWYGHINYSNRALAKKYYQLPLSALNRLPSVATTDDFSIASTAFANGDWITAIEHFKNVPSAASNYRDAQFFLGHTYFNSGDYITSLEIFNLLDEGDNTDQEAIDWMIILSMLKADQDEELILEELDHLMETRDHAFFENAAQLKQKLQSIWRIL